MRNLWNFLKSRISTAERRPSDQPFLHEAIDFTQFPNLDFLEWKGGSNHALMKQRLRQAYFNFSVDGKSLDQAFEFYDTPMSSGFIIFHRPGFTLTAQDYRFFQHSISELLKEERYILNLADVRSQVKGNNIEKIFKYYLKPSARLRQAPKAQQLFGNISIEFILRDENPYMLRCMAHSYNDQNFLPPIPFNEFVDKIVT